MQFKVPKFLETEIKIFGPLTFKQTLFLGLGGMFLFLLYFVLPRTIFIICAIFLVGGIFSFSFLRVGGNSLPETIKDFLGFSISSRVYIWQKKEAIRYVKVTPKKKEKKEIEETPLKIAPESKLSKLSSKIETGIR